MKNIFRSKLLKIGFALVLVVALVCGIALPIAAQGNNQKTNKTSEIVQLNTIKGKVTSIAEDQKSFVIQPRDGNPVTFTVDTNTKFFKTIAPSIINAPINLKAEKKIQVAKEKLINKMPMRFNERGLGDKNGLTLPGQDEEDTVDIEIDPEETPEMEQGLLANCRSPQGFMNKMKSLFNRNPKFGQTAQFTDIAVGDGVIVRVMPNESLAKQVLIIKTPVIKTIRGNVTDVNTADKTMIIQPATGDAVTVKWDANTTFILKGLVSVSEAKYATVIYNKETGLVKTATLLPVAPTTPPANTNT